MLQLELFELILIIFITATIKLLLHAPLYELFYYFISFFQTFVFLSKLEFSPVFFPTSISWF